MRILVADDDAVSRRLLQSYLERWGHEVVVAADGREAWQLFQQQAFPVVISDWMMPEMDGPELVRHIRSAAPHDRAFVILLTARAQKEDFAQGIEAGADDLVIKPFDREALRLRLRAIERLVALEAKCAELTRQLGEVQAALADTLARGEAIAARFAASSEPPAQLAAELRTMVATMRAELEKLRSNA